MTSDVSRIQYERAPCGLATTTVTGTITEANATLSEWTGHSPEHLLGRAFTSLLDPGSRIFYETRHAQTLHLRGAVDEVALTMITADGSRLPVLVNAVLTEDQGSPVILYAIFNATQRLAYERDLLDARRSAERSEARLQIVQNITDAFEHSNSDEDVAEAFVRVARGAFAATETCVMLIDTDGQLRLVAGANPLLGVVPAISSIRETSREIIVTVDEALTDHPRLAEGLRAARLEALSAIPLEISGERLGLFVCFFGRSRDFDTGFFELQRALARQASQTLARVRLQRELEHLAHYDQVTDIPNRQLTTQRLREAIDDAAANGEPLTVIFVDVDDFKEVNDRFGHTAGDAVLRELAHRFCDAVRTGDKVGRIGGDEFVVICEAADLDSAATIAERLLAVAREAISSAPADLRVSVSVGAATYTPTTEHPPTPDEVLNRADDAMYASKARGKNQFSLIARSPDTR